MKKIFAIISLLVIMFTGSVYANIGTTKLDLYHASNVYNVFYGTGGNIDKRGYQLQVIKDDKYIMQFINKDRIVVGKIVPNKNFNIISLPNNQIEIRNTVGKGPYNEIHRGYIVSLTIKSLGNNIYEITDYKMIQNIMYDDRTGKWSTGRVGDN